MNRQITEGETLYLDLLKKALTGSLYDESAWLVLEPRNSRHVKDLVRTAIIKAFRKRSLLLVKTRPYDRHRRETGYDWPMIGFTMVGHRRLDNISACIEKIIADDVAGDFVECGVWRGGASIFAKALFKIHGVTDRKVWLAEFLRGDAGP